MVTSDILVSGNKPNGIIPPGKMSPENKNFSIFKVAILFS